MLTNGWLKRQRLNKLAGESARGKQEAELLAKVKKSEAEKKKIMMIKRAQVVLAANIPKCA